MSIRKLVFKIKIKSGGCLVNRKPWHIGIDLMTGNDIGNFNRGHRRQRTEERGRKKENRGPFAPNKPSTNQ